MAEGDVDGHGLGLKLKAQPVPAAMQHMFPFLSPGGKPETLPTMLRRAFFALFASSAVFADSAPDLGLKPEMLHGILRDAAAKIEARYGSERPEAEKLVERIEAILATEPPPAREGDRAQAIAEGMHLINLDASAKASLGGYRGYLFDGSLTGCLQTYHDLEKLDAKDADEVLRWIDMHRAAEELDWDDKAAFCKQRAIGTARALVSREPKNPTAQVLLASALDWDDDSGSETLSALKTALKLDPKHPMATAKLLLRRIHKALEAAATRQPAALDERGGGDMLHQLYDRPLSAEEVTAFEQELQALGKEVDQLLATASERRDLGGFLHGAMLRMELRKSLLAAMASQKRPPDISFEAFAGEVHQRQIMQIFIVLDNAALFGRAIELSGANAEAVGTLAMLHLVGQMMHRAAEGSEPSEEQNARVKAVTERLVQIARADDSLNAARAAEAVCIIGMVRVMMDQKPEHIDMLPRTLQLDPFRHRTLGFLAAAAMTLKEKRDVTAAAAMTLQLAALPGLPTRKLAAAGAAKIGDYDTALRLLDDCAKEKPGDLMILHQRIATLLRQSQSKATIKKATLLYGDITPDTVIEKTATLEKADRQTFLHTYLLHHLLKPETQTASEVLTKLLDEHVLDKSTADEVRKWMEK